MRGFRMVCAGLATAIAVGLAAQVALAQTATAEPVGKPMALLAGLRPPHDGKQATKHEPKTAHAKTPHRTSKKIAARKTHSRMARSAAAGHKRHMALKKHEHREPNVAAAAVAAPALQPVQSSTAATAWPAVDMPAPAGEPDTSAVPIATAPRSDDAGQNAHVIKIQTLKVNSTGQLNSLDQAAPPAASSDHTDTAPAPQTVVAAPAQQDLHQAAKVPNASLPNASLPASSHQVVSARDASHQHVSRVGSASWIAQVLAALGGAVAAGSVAWFLIGSGPLRTYG